MMKNESVVRDERTTVIENSSYKLAYTVLSFGLLLIAGYRAYFSNESSWDLMALLFLGGLVATAYQASHRILSKEWVRTAIIIVILGAIVGAAFFGLVVFLNLPPKP